MNVFDMSRLSEIVEGFSKRTILVLGDLMLDRYLWGHVSRISPEAPVPVVAVNKETSCLGGAGNVSRNLQSLGASVLLAGLVGDDAAGRWIKSNAPSDKGIFTDPKSPTTLKTRIIAHHQQVVRVDQEEVRPLSKTVRDSILSLIRNEPYDGLLVSDYNKGIVSQGLMEAALEVTRERKIPVFVDPKVENFSHFSPVTLITPNHFEAERIVNYPCHSDPDVERAGAEILSRISSEYLILKRGEQGMTVFEKGQPTIHIPTVAKEVYDVTGAGDTVIAAASLALLVGATIQEAALLANTAAGIVVGKLGTATLTQEELLDVLPTFDG
jgi:D-beta-D-heptose 7-phosphate kinase/D-beta-D-heptose 1-phosphate adenosyltransferase